MGKTESNPYQNEGIGTDGKRESGAEKRETELPAEEATEGSSETSEPEPTEESDPE